MSNSYGEAYQDKFDSLAQRGIAVHGEASMVRSLAPGSVLDAGCGTGRVAIELARHDIEVVGVDLDIVMLSEARRRAPELTWVQADLATLALGRLFDVVVLAGNVPLFCSVSTRPALIEACANHVASDGAMVAGFQLDQGFSLDDYDLSCKAGGLTLVERWSTWNGEPYVDGGGYAVSLHRR